MLLIVVFALLLLLCCQTGLQLTQMRTGVRSLVLSTGRDHDSHHHHLHLHRHHLHPHLLQLQMSCQSVHAVSPCTSQETWHNVDKDDTEPPQPVFRPARTPGPQLLLTASYTALQLFQLFFSTSVLQTIVQNTNVYGAKMHQGRNKPWHNISGENFKSYLVLVVYMGLVKVSTLTDYWRRSRMYSFHFPAQIMSCRKFLTITNALHLSNPQDDEENEKRKGYNNIRDACKTFFHANQNISIDERMVESKARSGLKQYMKNKPTKWGYKLFVLADSLCGYTCEFFVYEGKAMQSRNGQLLYQPHAFQRPPL